MKNFFHVNKYEGWIDFSNKYVWNCTCEYGSVWRGKKTNPCRHVRIIMSMMKLSEHDREVLKKLVNYTCESCKNKKDPKELEIHRIKRGYNGGEYVPRNLMILCKECHKTFHSKEFR